MPEQVRESGLTEQGTQPPFKVVFHYAAAFRRTTG